MFPVRSRAMARAGSPVGVLFVETSRYPSYGGTKRAVVQMATALDRARFAPHVIVYRDGAWVADLKAAGVPVTIVRMPGPDPVARSTSPSPHRSVAARLRGLGVRIEPDGAVHLDPARQVIADLAAWRACFGRDLATARRLAPLVPRSTRILHVNHSMAGDLAWFHVARRLGLAFLTHEHGHWKPRSAAWRTAARAAAGVLCLTERRVAEVRAFMQGRVRAELLPNGVALDALRPARGREAVREALRIRPATLLVVTAGHLQAWKGQALAVEAASRLAAAGLEFTWLLCGAELEPAYADGLRARIAERRLGGVVRLLGERSDLPDLFAASDLAVHTSVQPEPFGLVVLEAMAQGLPVVGPCEGALPELVRDGIDGRLVPARDPAAIAGAILDLARQPELLRRMGDSGRAAVRERFDARVLVRRLEAVYTRALGPCSGSEAGDPVPARAAVPIG